LLGIASLELSNVDLFSMESIQSNISQRHNINLQELTNHYIANQRVSGRTFETIEQSFKNENEYLQTLDGFEKRKYIARITDFHNKMTAREYIAWLLKKSLDHQQIENLLQNSIDELKSIEFIASLEQEPLHAAAIGLPLATVINDTIHYGDLTLLESNNTDAIQYCLSKGLTQEKIMLDIIDANQLLSNLYNSDIDIEDLKNMLLNPTLKKKKFNRNTAQLSDIETIQEYMFLYSIINKINLDSIANDFITEIEDLNNHNVHTLGANELDTTLQPSASASASSTSIARHHASASATAASATRYQPSASASASSASIARHHASASTTAASAARYQPFVSASASTPVTVIKKRCFADFSPKKENFIFPAENYQYYGPHERSITFYKDTKKTPLLNADDTAAVKYFLEKEPQLSTKEQKYSSIKEKINAAYTSLNDDINAIEIPKKASDWNLDQDLLDPLKRKIFSDDLYTKIKNGTAKLEDVKTVQEYMLFSFISTNTDYNDMDKIINNMQDARSSMQWLYIEEPIYR